MPEARGTVEHRGSLPQIPPRETKRSFSEEVSWVLILFQVAWKTMGDNTGTWSPWLMKVEEMHSADGSKAEGVPHRQDLRGASHKVRGTRVMS